MSVISDALRYPPNNMPYNMLIFIHLIVIRVALHFFVGFMICVRSLCHSPLFSEV